MRVKKANLQHRKDEAQRIIKETAELVSKCNVEISDLDEKHPEYKHQFMKKYEDALKAAGVSKDSNPLIKYMGL